ncbi:MAG: tetratricopeptide repeat protein [Bacillota bacterium]
MADLPAGYRDVSPDDQAKAKKFFEHGKTVADTGNYDYAIDLYLMGLNVDPDAREGHEGLRNISLIRKASGGKDLGFMEKAKLRRSGKDEKQNLLNIAKLLAYDPGNTDHMVSLLQCAQRAGYYDTAMWMGPILLRANADSKSPDFHKYIALKDVYKELSQWKLATEACHFALRLKPLDMDLQAELKNLSALETMNTGKYESANSFRESIRDKDKQQELLDSERDVVGDDFLLRRVKEAEAEWKADPNETGKVSKYVDALEATEDPENENRAIEVLEAAYARTKQFRFRQRVGKIKMTQLSRMERSLRQARDAEPNDAALQKDYEQFKQEQLEFELGEFKLAAEAYPTDLSLRYQIANRLFALKRYDEAIPVFQQARVDPKISNDATVLLGRAFLEAGFVDEAIDTLQQIIDTYDVKGDERSKDMNYWQGRALEQKGNLEQALKRYSQVAQWEFTYRDVQTRIKTLRAKK